MNRRFLLPLFAVLFALAGCSDRAASPLSPEPAAPAALLGLDPVLSPVTSLLGVEPVSLDGVLQFVTLPNLAGTRSVSKRIRASTGGYVELEGFRVDIPAGALPQDTVVTINLPADPVLGKRVIAEFLPHGVQFNTPVTLSFPLQGVALPLFGGIEVAPVGERRLDLAGRHGELQRQAALLHHAALLHLLRPRRRVHHGGRLTGGRARRAFFSCSHVPPCRRTSSWSGRSP